MEWDWGWKKSLVDTRHFEPGQCFPFAKPNNVESDHQSVARCHLSVESDCHLVDPYYPLVVTLDIPSLDPSKTTIDGSKRRENPLESIKNSGRYQLCKSDVLEDISCRFHLFQIGNHSHGFFSLQYLPIISKPKIRHICWNKRRNHNKRVNLRLTSVSSWGKRRRYIKNLNYL